MNVYFDENFTPNLIYGLSQLNNPLNRKGETPIEIVSVKVKFGEGVADEDWVKKLNSNTDVMVTQDAMIAKRPQQRQLLENRNIGAIFVVSPNKRNLKYWEIVELLVANWQRIRTLTETQTMPFMYKLTQSKGLVKLQPKQH